MDTTSSSSKMDVMKPVLCKAGIPLAITLAGFIITRIAAWRSCLLEDSLPLPDRLMDIQETGSSSTFEDDESFHSLDSVCPSHVQGDHTCEEARFKEEIFGLRKQVEYMQEQERKLEERFLSYQASKDREMTLRELQNKLISEADRVEFMGREVALLDAERQRYEVVAVEYLIVLRNLQLSRSENESLHKRVYRLSQRNKEHAWSLRRQCRQIELKEAEIVENKKELEVKGDYIRSMESEINKLKLIIEQLQGEKVELLKKLREAEESTISKVGETVAMENHNQLKKELEQQQKDEAAEIEELIYLRWSNACLRHNLMRQNQEHEQEQENKQMEDNVAEIEEFRSDNEPNQCYGGESASYLGFTAENRAGSRRQKLITKLKRWMEGSQKAKCLWRFSVSNGTDRLLLPARKSCSSA